MGTSFNRWEKDPFFSAAEEVQESADRMESAYRTWIHAKKDATSIWDSEQLLRDLHTAVGTTKWQLDEFQRAVQPSYSKSSSDDARGRHHEFVVVIEDQVAKIEKSLMETARSEGLGTPRWVRLDEGERNELALFLSGPSESEHEGSSKYHLGSSKIPEETEDRESMADCSINSRNLADLVSSETKEKPHNHRRTASASADTGAWKIMIPEDSYMQQSSSGHSHQTPRKTPSVSGLLDYTESAASSKWLKNCVRKWKATDHQQESDAVLLPIQSTRQVMSACYEKSKSCLECEDCYDKPLNGWYGAMKRQLQRSQYQMQYSRPVQVTISVLLLLFLIVLIICAV